ncbi:MAG TPA: tRNA threonylcarbamoyladenosine dehydratase, partial [Candidatus Hydrogenedentes bacterium]|jgi:tRNA A37 threonylcarbamoyladenosine dehydratase|nr:tRNA threonylcarbamoyladenosine dehydratase [Candidatus Hydrogenedentota bacterium]
MDARFERTRLLVGDAGLKRLSRATVVIFGLGGVGSYAAEAVARAGVGHLVLVDSDCVEPTNLNRQLLALESTLGQPKVEVARARILDIHPGARVEVHQTFVTPANVHEFLREGREVSYIDAIDHLLAKVALLKQLHERRARFVSCMGAASKLDVSGVRVADISATANCRLARRIRLRLRREGITSGVRCVYTEGPVAPGGEPQNTNTRVRGTISYLPGLIGLTAAGIVLNEILA